MPHTHTHTPPLHHFTIPPLYHPTTTLPLHITHNGKGSRREIQPRSMETLQRNGMPTGETLQPQRAQDAVGGAILPETRRELLGEEEGVQSVAPMDGTAVENCIRRQEQWTAALPPGQGMVPPDRGTDSSHKQVQARRKPEGETVGESAQRRRTHREPTSKYTKLRRYQAVASVESQGTLRSRQASAERGEKKSPCHISRCPLHASPKRNPKQLNSDAPRD